MDEAEAKRFLAQFDKAREDFKTWPKWMQDAAVERAATFPKFRTSIGDTPAPQSTERAKPCCGFPAGGPCPDCPDADAPAPLVSGDSEDGGGV